MKNKITIQEIANWQLDHEESEVILPTVQRGFVWKPKQIEDLWDSILRGFPIGSFLFSKTTDSKYLLMDGQQRATAIATGFYNPFIKNDKIGLWSIKGNLPILWIDIDPLEKPDRNLFLMRVVTRSHPWGYYRRDNSKILSCNERVKAFELFSKNNQSASKYTDFSNTTVFPFDSYFPIPLSFFFIANTSEDVIEACKKFLPENFYTSHSEFKDKQEFIKLLSIQKREKIDKIFQYAKIAKKQTYNFDVLDNNVLMQEEEEEPTLFIRINSSGTALNGDDLIYSIYKSCFPQTKDFIENIAPDFISPKLNISLASRIVYSLLNGDSYPNKMSVKDFQRNIKNDEFKNKLSKLIGTKNNSEFKNLMSTAISILCSPTSSITVPPVIVKNLINRHSDIFLFLLYWLLKNSNNSITDKDKLNITGGMTYYTWFGLDIRKLSKELWEYKDSPEFWQNAIKKDFLNNLCCILPEPSIFKDYLLINQKSNEFQPDSEYSKEIKKSYHNLLKEEYSEDQIKNYYETFFKKLYGCKPMILLAQRSYLAQEFGTYNQFEDLEDTNIPWDWDHIYPHSWVYQKHYVDKNIRLWINSIGNFRALALSQNRSENNLLSPSERLKDAEQREISFVQEDWKYWSKITDRIFDDQTDNYTKAVKTRMANIYAEWWNYFNIGDIIPK